MNKNDFDRLKLLFDDIETEIGAKEIVVDNVSSAIGKFISSLKLNMTVVRKFEGYKGSKIESSFNSLIDSLDLLDSTSDEIRKFERSFDTFLSFCDTSIHSDGKKRSISITPLVNKYLDFLVQFYEVFFKEAKEDFSTLMDLVTDHPDFEEN